MVLFRKSNNCTNAFAKRFPPKYLLIIIITMVVAAKSSVKSRKVSSVFVAAGER